MFLLSKLFPCYLYTILWAFLSALTSILVSNNFFSGKREIFFYWSVNCNFTKETKSYYITISIVISTLYKNRQNKQPNSSSLIHQTVLIQAPLKHQLPICLGPWRNHFDHIFHNFDNSCRRILKYPALPFLPNMPDSDC